MVRIQVERVYSANRERVFDVLTDHAGWTAWAGAGTVTLERRGKEHANGVGCIRVIRNGPVAVREEVTEFRVGELMIYRLLGAPGVRDHEGELAFEDLGHGKTRVVWRCRFQCTRRLMEWPAKVGVQLFFKRVLARLDDHLKG